MSDAAEPKPLRVALLGFGTVGASVARILVERPELARRLQLTHVFNRDVAAQARRLGAASVTWTDDSTTSSRPRPTSSSKWSAASSRRASG